MSEHGRHLPQYFTLFVMYASLGAAEKTQLLRLNVPATFIQVALDEGPGPPIKYQYAELSKLYQVFGPLVWPLIYVLSRLTHPDPSIHSAGCVVIGSLL